MYARVSAPITCAVCHCHHLFAFENFFSFRIHFFVYTHTRIRVYINTHAIHAYIHAYSTCMFNVWRRPHNFFFFFRTLIIAYTVCIAVNVLAFERLFLLYPWGTALVLKITLCSRANSSSRPARRPSCSPRFVTKKKKNTFIIPVAVGTVYRKICDGTRRRPSLCSSGNCPFSVDGPNRNRSRMSCKTSARPATRPTANISPRGELYLYKLLVITLLLQKFPRTITNI